jgi:glyoxylase-like metal-dependent hydrolase (beta-lactamase superfamily II)
MKKILTGIYTENAYPGVTVGALVFPTGTILIDSPILPDDGRAWLKALHEEGGGDNRLLVNLDSHPDRTLGVRAMEATVVAHEAVKKVFEQRPSIFKAQVSESGSEWETCTGLSGLRWMPPNVAFTEQTQLHWGEEEVFVEHHPGPETGASWVLLPERKVVFIGDAVPVKQPPFLAKADPEAWIETLDHLLSSTFKGYKIISSRGGLVKESDIRSTRKFLVNVHKQLQRLARRKTPPQATEKLVDKLLISFESPAKYRNFYAQRLKYGLYNCYTHTYQSNT